MTKVTLNRKAKKAIPGKKATLDLRMRKAKKVTTGRPPVITVVEDTLLTYNLNFKIAKRMLVSGKLTYKDIAAFTDLTLEEIKALAIQKTA